MDVHRRKNGARQRWQLCRAASGMLAPGWAGHDPVALSVHLEVSFTTRPSIPIICAARSGDLPRV